MKKKFLFLFIAVTLGTASLTAQVGIGNKAPEGILDTNNTQYYPVVVPQGVEADIVNPQGGQIKQGSIYFDTTQNCLRLYQGTEWTSLDCTPRMALAFVNFPTYDYLDIDNDGNHVEPVDFIKTNTYPLPGTVPASMAKFNNGEYSAQPLWIMQVVVDQKTTASNFMDMKYLYIGKVIAKGANGEKIVVTNSMLNTAFLNNDPTKTDLNQIMLFRTPFDQNLRDGDTPLLDVEIGLIGKWSGTITEIYPPFYNTAEAKTILELALNSLGK